MTALAAAPSIPALLTRWPPDKRRTLALCAALSLVLHAVLMLAMHPGSETAPQQAAHSSARAPRTIELRLIAPPLPAAQTPEPTIAAAPAPAPAPQARPSAATPPSETVPVPEATTRQAVKPGDPTASSDALPVAPPTNARDHDDYIPRPLLTVAPVSQGVVIIEPPPVDLGIARHVGILSLFIDEHGEVRRIAADEPLLPPPLEQAAREAFMAARFAPGEVDGRAVKSRIRVEVVFDSTPLR